MLNFNQTTPITADNKVSFCGIEYMITDDEATKLKSILDGMVSARGQQASAPVKNRKPLIIPDETTRKEQEIVGKKIYQEDFLTISEVDGKYRLYITCPLGGEKGKKIRYAIKATAKEAGAKFAGNYDAGEIFWEFSTKKAAQEYVKARKEYAKKAEA